MNHTKQQVVDLTFPCAPYSSFYVYKNIPILSFLLLLTCEIIDFYHAFIYRSLVTYLPTPLGDVQQSESN